ncbi:MAG: excisionase family DNA-binding protein [Armatimonas sp.]
MPALLDDEQTLEASPANQQEAKLLAELLEKTRIPGAEAMHKKVLALLQAIASGQNFAILALDTDLSPNEAADLLGISRTYFMRALHSGAIPYHRIGAHYRVFLKDVLKFKEANQQKRKILAELTAQAQELDMGY